MFSLAQYMRQGKVVDKCEGEFSYFLAVLGGELEDVIVCTSL